MSTTDQGPRGSGAQRHGNVFERGSGKMHIHVHRESGLAHGSMILKPWQVQALRLVASRWFALIATAALLSWAWFAFQAARVPFLTRRITHLEQDSAKIDTLQATIEQVQKRYDQVQQMLSASGKDAPKPTPKTTSPTAPTAAPSKAPAGTAH